MTALLTFCLISLAMLKWHSQPATRTAAIAEPKATPVGRFGYDNSVRTKASLFKGCDKN